MDSQDSNIQDDVPVDIVIPECNNRPYNHLINNEADTAIFNKTFNEDKIDSVIKPYSTNYVNNVETSGRRTGLTYYEDCVNHYCIWDENYEENPRRFTRILERMKEMDLLSKCHQIKPRKAIEKEILLVHTPEYLEKVAHTSNIIDPDILEKESSKYDAVYFNPSTYESALFAAGSTVQLADLVMREQISNGFAIVRPPGHHAMSSEACGYCIFNNVAIAASYCLDKFNLSRILIVDWDVHHGQATQQKFYNDNRVLYASIHRYEFGTFWPELAESNHNYVGQDKGRGYNVNIPINETALTDADYLSIWHNVLLPIFYDFNPELVFVSAGYDAAIGCPEGEMLLTSAFYEHVTHSLMGLANGKVCVVLEGGYCTESLADGAASTLRILLGNSPIPLNLRYPIKQSVVNTVLNAISSQKSYWDILKMQQVTKCYEEGEKPREIYIPTLEYKGIPIESIEKPQSYPTRDCYPIQSNETRNNYLNDIIAFRNYAECQYLSYDTKRTCIITVPDISGRHAYISTHPERPNRTKFLWKFLKNQKILDQCHVIKDNNRQATYDQIRLCHSEEDIEKVTNTQLMPYKELREYESQFDSLYFTRDTFQVAKYAAGSLLQVVDCVMENQCLNGFACIRPPGHHASRTNPAGFCIFNNVSIAARYAIEKFHLKRVMIVDWDVHHGDGTQDIFDGDENVLFFSLHRFDRSTFYPEKQDSNISSTKNIINIPWNDGFMGDKEYVAAFFNIILPIAYNFNPELVLVSAGFDSGQGDPLGEYHVSPQAYGQMTHMLSSLANGKIILTLEGGYNLKTIADSAYECIQVLLGNPPKSLPLKDVQLNESAVKTIQKVIDYQAKNWPCLKFNFDIDEYDT